MFTYIFLLIPIFTYRASQLPVKLPTEDVIFGFVREPTVMATSDKIRSPAKLSRLHCIGIALFCMWYPLIQRESGFNSI